MKFLRLFQLALFAVTIVCASAAESFSVHRHYLSADGSRYVDEVVYYDGLGRPVETVQRGITPAGQSIHALQQYDAAGRPGRTWLPVVGDGSFMGTEAVKAAAEALYDDSHPFSTIVYEPSPLENIDARTRPGDILANTAISTLRYVNTQDAEFAAIRFSVGQDGSITNDGLLGNGILSALKTVDEDGRTLIEFSDYLGRKVLSRQKVSASAFADTYFVYDDFGDLRYIVPPLAADVMAAVSAQGSSWDCSDAVVDDYCYYYEKNILGQTTLFKQPGREAVLYRYDAANRLTLTQDGNQRKASKWTFSFSDRCGRDVISGEMTLNDGEVNDILADSHVARLTGTGAVGGYVIDGNNARADGFFNADIINYYDSYSFIPADRNPSFAFQPCQYSGECQQSAMGRLTGSLVSGKLSVFYYDRYGNEVQAHTDNHLGFTDSRYSTFSFNDKPLSVRRITRFGVGRTATEDLRYTYDNKDRPLAIYHSLDGADEVCLQTNSYNELLQVAAQNVGPAVQRAMQYDLNGRLTDIQSDVFSSHLTYEKQGCMAGNISSQRWNNGNSYEKYNYSYDLMNRLTAAEYKGATNGLYSTSYSYDKMANPLSVVRYGRGYKSTSGSLSAPTKGKIDDLIYLYTGHHIRAVLDRATAFKSVDGLDFDFAGSEKEYGYDANGNICFDPDRDMNFTYDRNNMPLTVVRNSNFSGLKKSSSSITLSRYSYDAAGTRQAVVHTVPASTSTSGGFISSTPERTFRRDYVGSVILLDSVIERINIPGGYIDAHGNYFFYLTDYLGNNRAVVNIDGTPVQRTDYYPYGLPLRQTGASAQPYKFGAKEFDPTNALNSYDFHARQYFPAAIVWQSMDFHAADYPQISPFSYCTANPIIFIDPDGNDRYYFDRVGNFIRAEKEEDYDNVVIQNHGCFEESEPMPYGTIEDVWRWKAANGNYYDYLKVRGDENARKIFEFFAKNLNIEYMLLQCGQSGDEGVNFISTSHNKEEDRSGCHLWNYMLRFGYSLRIVIHNHPTQRLNPSETDIEGLPKAVRKITPNVKYYVYTVLEWPNYGHYREYGPTTVYRKMTSEQYKYAEKGKKCLGY